MRAAQTAAGVYQFSGDLERALALHRQIIGIADLTLSPNDASRGTVRISAAFAFAGMHGGSTKPRVWRARRSRWGKGCGLREGNYLRHRWSRFGG